MIIRVYVLIELKQHQKQKKSFEQVCRSPGCKVYFPGLRRTAEEIQNTALNVARFIPRYQDHKRTSPEGGPGVSVAFFQMIYQVVIGQERGPRFGSFAALYGAKETAALVEQALAGELTGVA